jgi:threonine aldolase
MSDAQNDLEQFRSTCTRFLNGHGNRTAAQILAEIPADLGLDRYGDGGAVAALEAEIRERLGKPAAAFFPSGTMAQQSAMRIHADRRGRRTIAFHPTCHLEMHEDKAYQRLHSLVGVTVGNARSLITLQDLKAMKEPLAAVLFELPQREIGGVLPAWDDLERQVAYVRTTGAAVHLDGARLWESAPFYGKTPAEIATLFDSVYVSFYKGIGALAGACLAGEEDFIAEARLWRKRHGGTLFGMWPNAASALAGLRQRLPLMPRYVEHAGKVAAALRGVIGVQVVPDPPHTNMMHIHLRATEERFKAAACRIAREKGVYTWARSMPGPVPGMRTVELTVGDATLRMESEEVAGITGDLVA